MSVESVSFGKTAASLVHLVKCWQQLFEELTTVSITFAAGFFDLCPRIPQTCSWMLCQSVSQGRQTLCHLCVNIGKKLATMSIICICICIHLDTSQCEYWQQLFAQAVPRCVFCQPLN